MAATVTIATHSRVYSDRSVSVTGGSLTAYDDASAIADGDTVFVYYDDPNRLGGTVTFKATKVLANAVNSASQIGRHFVGQVTVPTSGSIAGAGANPVGVQGAQTGINLKSATYGNLTDAQLVTALGTAAAITGQGSLATQSSVNLGSQVTGTLGTGNAASGLINSNVPVAGANRVPFSLFEAGINGWYINAYGGAYGAALTTAASGAYTDLVYNGTMTAAGQYNGIDGNAFPVTAGENLAIQARISTNSNTTSNFCIAFRNAAGAEIAVPTVVPQGVGSGVTAGPGMPTDYLFQGTWTVPTGATSALVRWIVTSVASGATHATLSQPMVMGVASGQTVYPAFAPGPNAYNGADVTGQNTAFNTAYVGAYTPSQVLAANAGGNLVYKPTFTDGSYGQWGASSGTGMANTPGSSVSVNASYGSDGTGELDQTCRDIFEGGNVFTVAPGDIIYVSAWCWTAAGSSHSSAIGLHFTDASGGTPQWIAGATLAAGSNWTLITGKLTVPSGAALATPWLQNNGSGTGLPYIAWNKIFIGRHQPGADVTGSNTANNTNNVGSISSGSVSSTIKSGGGVANSQVITASIVTGAVSTASVASSSTSINTTSTTPVTALSVTVNPTSSNSTYLIFAIVTGYGTNTSSGQAPFYVSVTGTDLTPKVINSPNVAYQTPVTLMTTVSGISSTTTFNLQYSSYTSGYTAYMFNYKLVAVELKV